MGSPQTAVLYQVVKVLFGIGEEGVGGLDDNWRSTPKWFLGRNSLQPALSGKFFVIGKVETHEELDSFGGRGWRSISFGLDLPFRLVRLIGFVGFGTVFSRSGGDAFKLEEEFLVEAIGLLPALEFVACLLNFLLVFCEVKLNVDVGHKISLRLAGGVSQEMPVDCGASSAQAGLASYLAWRGRGS